MAFASMTSANGSSKRVPLIANRTTGLERDGHVLGVVVDRRVPELHAHDRLHRLQRDVQVRERLGLVRRAPDVMLASVE